MRSAFHGSVFYHLPARQLLPMGALSPRRRRCSSALQRVYRVLAAMSFCGLFCGLRYNPIRIQRLFLPTFSGKAEKVGLRSNGCGVTAFNGSPVNPDKRADRVISPYKLLCRIICEAMVAASPHSAAPPAPAGKNQLRAVQFTARGFSNRSHSSLRRGPAFSSCARKAADAGRRM